MYKRGAKGKADDTSGSRRVRTASNSPPGKGRPYFVAHRDKLKVAGRKGQTTAHRGNGGVISGTASVGGLGAGALREHNATVRDTQPVIQSQSVTPRAAHSDTNSAGHFSGGTYRQVSQCAPADVAHGSCDTASGDLLPEHCEDVFPEDLQCHAGGNYSGALSANGADKVHFAITEVSDEVSDSDAAGAAEVGAGFDAGVGGGVIVRRSQSGSSGSSRARGGRRSSGSAVLSKSPCARFISPVSTLQQRRGSSVTFNLPAHVSSSDDSSSSYSRRQSIPSVIDDPVVSFYERYLSLYSRRMSAPELPPIADRPRPPSRSNSKSSLNQLTAAVSSKSFYSRLTNGAKLPRNHSDSSLKGLLATTASQHQSSGSVSSYMSGGGGLHNTPGSGGEQLLPHTQLLRSASRALSWCATDNSTGSIPKLETLFERKIAVIDNDMLDRTTTPQLISKNNSNNNILNNNNNQTANNNMIPSRSVSVNGMRRDSHELAKLTRGRKMRLQSDSGTGDETVGTIEQFRHLKLNGIRRASSENKLIDKKNVRNARLNSSRHLSVNRMDRLIQRSPPANAPPRSSASVTLKTGAMRRVNSVAAINVTANRTSRLGSVFHDGNDVDGHSGESEEEEEKSSRIRDWLVGLEYADVPPDPVIEYADDPPQTDTAVHIVYQDD